MGGGVCQFCCRRVLQAHSLEGVLWVLSRLVKIRVPTPGALRPEQLVFPGVVHIAVLDQVVNRAHSQFHPG